MKLATNSKYTFTYFIMISAISISFVLLASSGFLILWAAIERYICRYAVATIKPIDSIDNGFPIEQCTLCTANEIKVPGTCLYDSTYFIMIMLSRSIIGMNSLTKLRTLSCYWMQMLTSISDVICK